MSLYGTMRTGVSGMNAQANRLSTVADNIANSSTVGYKKASVQFSSMILPSSGSSYNSGGVESTVRYDITAESTYTFTTSGTDLAVKGEGFFIVQGASGVEYLTRAGNFVEMSDGTLQNAAGYTLMGYPYNDGVDPTIVINGYDGLEPVKLGTAAIAAKASENGRLPVNLTNTAAVGDTFKTSLSAIDTQGTSRLIEFTYTKTGANAWTIEGKYNGTTVLAATPVTFDALGVMTAPTTPVTTTALTTGLGGAEMKSIAIDLTGTTQLASDSAPGKAGIDGSKASKATGYEINAEGVVSIKYDNGSLVPTYRIALATVQSPNNLLPVAGNLYTTTTDSGVVVLGYAQNGAFGSVLSGALEDSNVDVAAELTSMIESQRNYTANSKVFQTGSELMEVLVNLKR
ncbi:flagellar hook protein FlgE [Rhizobium sp. RU36D]|uniref:flagellar hook protein FlgE n=1 Tax=Rhizobium sp. RU36D TaxID=1907415 RepID=UPI0009D90D31|nr:flagellar hook protein FlgE [Rhizobium sp. RU36D]SMC84961.1 flagellar hook protein FlgE [Rhizobium sp. RU36D]